MKKRQYFTIDEINNILKPINISFIDSSYKNMKEPHKFNCLNCKYNWIDKLHFYMGYSKTRKSCPRCQSKQCSEISIQWYLKKNKIPLKLDANQKIKSATQKINIHCSKGHQIRTSFSQIKRFKHHKHSFCKRCEKNHFQHRRFNYYKEKLKVNSFLELIKVGENTARNRKFVFLVIRCKKSHITNIEVSHLRKYLKVKNKSGCKECDSIWWDIPKINKKIKESGLLLQLLDKKYVSNHHKLRFKCLGEGCNKIYKRCWGDVLKKIRKKHKDKTICKKCHHKRLTTWNLALIKKHLIQIDRKIECIAKKYKTNKTKMAWRCLECQKVWNATWKSINISEQGCPECNFVGKTEIAIRDFLSKVFKRKFSKIRPDWLNSHLSGRNLEIDCWNRSLNLGIEVNGEQHYKLMRYYGDSIKRLKRTQANDAIKVKICKKMNITLIVMPIHDCPKSKYKERLKKLLLEKGIKIPPRFDSIKLKV